MAAENSMVTIENDLSALTAAVFSASFLSALRSRYDGDSRSLASVVKMLSSVLNYGGAKEPVVITG